MARFRARRSRVAEPWWSDVESEEELVGTGASESGKGVVDCLASDWS